MIRRYLIPMALAVSQVRETLQAHGAAAPVAILLNFNGGSDLLDVVGLEDMSPSQLAAKIAHERPDAVMLIQEFVTLSDEDLAQGAKIMEEYPDLSLYPGVIPAMQFVLETPQHVWIGMAKITEQGGKRSFGEIDFVGPDAAAPRLFAKHSTH